MNLRKQHVYTRIAERALGRKLPPQAIVHHVNGDETDDRPGNLVICEDQTYHMLLHQRQRAYQESGDADLRKCSFCGRYDDPANLYYRKNYRHRECARIYNQAWKANWREQNNGEHYLSAWRKRTNWVDPRPGRQQRQRQDVLGHAPSNGDEQR